MLFAGFTVHNGPKIQQPLPLLAGHKVICCFSYFSTCSAACSAQMMLRLYVCKFEFPKLACKRNPTFAVWIAKNTYLRICCLG